MSETIQHNAANILAISMLIFTGVVSTQAKPPALRTPNQSKHTANYQINKHDEVPMLLTPSAEVY